MIGDWRGYLAEHAAEWGLPPNGDWRFLFYNNYHPNGSDIDILWFLGGERYPRVVSKLSRDCARLEHEFGNLRRVHAAAPRWAPEPLDFGGHGAFWAVWMRGAAGQRFSGAYTPAVLRSMADSVASLHSAIRSSGPTPIPSRYETVVAGPLAFLAEFGAAATVAEGSRRLRAETAAGWLDRLPVIPQHGDLYVGNLLQDGGEWSFVDWENFGMADIPMLDLYTLFISILRGGGDTSARWNRGLVAQMPDVAQRYAQKLGISPADMRALLPLSLANWFYIQRKSGRAEFLKSFYATVTDYFERTGCWERVFLGA